MNTTTSNRLWRREGDQIVVAESPNLGDTLLSMEDLRSIDRIGGQGRNRTTDTRIFST